MTDPNDVASVQKALRQIGWPLALTGVLDFATHYAIACFQQGWTPENLLVDGWAGPMTCPALDACLYYGGHASAHFRFAEFASHGDDWIRVNRTLLRGLEKYRTLLSPGGVLVVSGYRDPAYNAAQGGASNSQHLYGSACDLVPVATFEQVKALGVFSGIGYDEVTRQVRHVDTRGLDGAPATTPGTPAAPSWWTYPHGGAGS